MVITVDDFMAGWMGGIFGQVVGHPLDTTKVRQQTFGSTMMEGIRETFKHEGIAGFYRGFLFPFLTVGPSNAIFFGIYGNVMNLLQEAEKSRHHMSHTNIFVAGSVAGLFQTVFSCPIEVIKTVLQAKTDAKGHWKAHYEVKYTGSVAALRGLVRDRGIRALFKGMVPLLIRDVPTSGLYILTYEVLLYSKFGQCDTPTVIKQIVAGGTAGVASWVFVLPFDLVKTRLQTDSPDNPAYRGMLDCFYKSYKSEGLTIFFRGFPAVILRTFPVNAAIFVVYETTLSAFRSRL